MHPLLKKQIEEYFGGETSVPKELQGFISAVNGVFEQTVSNEAELSHAEERMRKIFNGANDAIFILDPELDKIVDANPRAVEMLGYSHAQLLAMPASAMHPNQQEEIKTFSSEVMNNGYGWTNELICTTNNGTNLPAEMSASVIDFANKKMILSIIRDISGRIEVEEELRRQQAFLRQVIDTNPSLVFAKDQEGKYTLANKAMAEAMDTTVEELHGKTDYPFNPDQERVEGYVKQDKQVFDTGEEFIDPEEYTISRQGQETYRHIIKRPLYDQEGNISQVLGIVNDITPLKMAERSLRQQNQSLEIISNISREISLTTSLDDLLAKASQAISDMLGITSNYICNWDENTNISTVLAESITQEASGSEQDISLGEVYKLDESLPDLNQWLKSSKEPKFINTEKDELNQITTDYYASNNVKIALYIPILLEDKTFGYIEIYESRNSRVFTQVEIDFLQALAYQLGIAFNNDNLFGALQSSEQRFRTLIENLTFVITIFNTKGKIIYAGPTTEAILGYTPEDLVGKSIFQKIHENDRRRVLEVTSNMLTTPGIVRDIQYQFQHKDGHFIDVESTANILYDEAGNMEFIVSSNDISNQVTILKRQQEQFERRGKQAVFTNQVSKNISLAKNRVVLYQEITKALQADLDIHYHYVQFFRYNPATNQLIVAAASGPMAETLLENGHQVSLHQGTSGKAAGQLVSVFVPDTRKEPGWQPTPHIENTKSEISTPVVLGDELLGVINVQSTEIEDFDTDIQVLLEVLSGQIAVAIDSIRLHTEMEERIEELNVLQKFASGEGWDSFHKSTPLTTTGYAFSPLDEKPSALTNGALGQGSGTENNLVKPMVVQGQEIGAIGIETDPSQPLSPEEQSLLDEITAEVSEALDRARLFEASQRSAAELAVLNEMGQAFTEALNEQAIIDNIFTYTSKLLEIDQFFVALVDEESNNIHFGLVYLEEQFVDPADLENPHAENWQPRSIGTGLTGHIISSRQPLLIEANAEEVLTTLNLPYVVSGGQMTQSWIGVPMTVGERVIGVINAQSDIQAGLYNDHHLGLLTSIAGQASIAIDNARLFEQEQKRAKQERLVRTITDRVRRGSDRETILKIALEEISIAMQTKKSVIKLGIPENLKTPNNKFNGSSNITDEQEA